MTWLEAIILGVVQGVTEFLPISSSGHLVLFQNLFGWDHLDTAKEMFFDGVLHLGTLLAVVVYFGRELKASARRVIVGGPPSQDAPPWPRNLQDVFYLLVLIGIATLPAALAMLWKNEEIKNSFKRPDVVVGNFIVLGGVLLVTDYLKPGSVTGRQTRWWHALLIGLAQGCSALFRGLSRSGSTMAAALIVGMDRAWAVRFSFMMSVVASLGLGASGIWKGYGDPNRAQWMTGDFLVKTIVATVVSAVVGYLTIEPLINLVKRSRLWVFAVYVWAVAGFYYLFPKLKVWWGMVTG